MANIEVIAWFARRCHCCGLSEVLCHRDRQFFAGQVPIIEWGIRWHRGSGVGTVYQHTIVDGVHD